MAFTCGHPCAEIVKADDDCACQIEQGATNFDLHKPRSPSQTVERFEAQSWDHTLIALCLLLLASVLLPFHPFTLRKGHELLMSVAECWSQFAPLTFVTTEKLEDEETALFSNRIRFPGMGRYEELEEWQDIVPIPQDEGGPNPLAAISYTDEYAEAMSYLRAVMAVDELSDRVLALTEHVISMNPAHYTVWSVEQWCLPTSL